MEGTVFQGKHIPSWLSDEEGTLFYKAFRAIKPALLSHLSFSSSERSVLWSYQRQCQGAKGSSLLRSASVFLLMLFPLEGMPFPSPLRLGVLPIFQGPYQIAFPSRNFLPAPQLELTTFLAVNSFKGYVFLIFRMLPISTTLPWPQTPSTGSACNPHHLCPLKGLGSLRSVVTVERL